MMGDFHLVVQELPRELIMEWCYAFVDDEN